MVAPCIALADSNPAMEILQHTATTYQNLQSYKFRVTVHTVRGSNVSQQRRTDAGSKPGKHRMEDDEPGGELQIGDGRMQWVFNPESGEYTKAPLTAESVTAISGFEQIDQHVTNADIAREEQFIVEGTPVPVYVVRVVRDQWPPGLAGTQFAMYRIDKKTFAVYKVITYSKAATQISLYSIEKWNQPVPETLFIFTPPESARAASSVPLRPARSTTIVGSEAPDFKLQDARGRPVTLSGLRGKVVVVDFWATWCPPCRALMPHLEKMQREFAKKGLVVLGLDVGEGADEVAEFAKQHSYTFTLVLGAEPDVSAEYYVEGYPTTFVIDRVGRITFRDLGGNSVDRLRSAVQSALAIAH
jgi:thiol-disulfide isomerase/thioredoxin